MKITNRLAIAMLATGAAGVLGARALQLQIPAMAQETTGATEGGAGVAAGGAEAAAPAAAPKPDAKATADPQALALLKQMEAAYKALKSYSGSVKAEESGTDHTASTSSGTVQWRKPNRFAIKRSGAAGSSMAVSNGTSLFVFSSSDKARYLKQEAPADSDGITAVLRQAGGTPLLLPYALSGKSLIEMFDIGKAKGTALTMAAPDTIDGTPVDVVTMTVADATSKLAYVFAMGHGDHLLRQVKFSGSENAKAGAQAQSFSYTETHTNVQANPDLPASAFAFKAPAGAKPVESLEPPAYDPKLKKGAAPIAFTAKDLTGKALSLSQYKGKVVLLDFWATWCGPCVGEAPNVVAAYKKYHAKGFDVVGISLDQDRKALDAFTKANKMPWRQVFDGKGWDSRVPGLYGVRSIPFALLIGRDGKIASLDVRAEALEPAIKAALARK